MKRLFFRAVLVLAIPTLVACSGGGSSSGGVVPGGGGSSTLQASFVPDEPSPGPGTVTLQRSSVNGSLVTINVVVTDVQNVKSAAFDVLFNPNQVEFIGHAAGAMLESGGATVQYQASLVGTNRVVVGAARVGSVGGTDAVGSESLMRLTFRVTRSGSSAATIENADLLDSQVQSIPGLVWAAGNFSATD